MYLHLWHVIPLVSLVPRSYWYQLQTEKLRIITLAKFGILSHKQGLCSHLFKFLLISLRVFCSFPCTGLLHFLKFVFRNFIIMPLKMTLILFSNVYGLLHHIEYHLFHHIYSSISSQRWCLFSFASLLSCVQKGLTIRQTAHIGPRRLLLQWSPQIDEWKVLTRLEPVWRSSNVGHRLLLRDILETKVQQWWHKSNT